jgi:two-component sensor histidine kinase
MAIVRDVTERKQAEKQIKASLKEKEVLLKEIHHRVKNNLQIISSLLKLQSRSIKDEQTLAMFNESQSRIRTMALIHESLYQSNDLSRINFAEYIQKLVANLLRSYEINSSAIKPVINVDNVLLEIDVAVPCGLIINELVSNSLKYAFPSGKEGKIQVDFYSENERNFTLTVSDNGVGLPKNLNILETKTLGLQLVNNLVDQLEGTVKNNIDGGTEFRITFSI